MGDIGGLRREGVGGDAAALGPGAEVVDFFGHGDGEGWGFFEGVEEEVGGEVGFGGEGVEEGGDDGLFDFAAGVAFGGFDEGGDVELLRVAFALDEVDAENLRAGVGDGEIDEEDFVEAAFAEELGGEGFDVVGGGDEEDGGGVLLHPGEEGAEHAFGEAAVDGLGGGGGEAFFDFVDPEDDGGHGLGLEERGIEAAFGFADEAVEEDGGIEAQEGSCPGGGDGFGGE